MSPSHFSPSRRNHCSEKSVLHLAQICILGGQISTLWVPVCSFWATWSSAPQFTCCLVGGDVYYCLLILTGESLTAEHSHNKEGMAPPPREVSRSVFEQGC